MAAKLDAEQALETFKNMSATVEDINNRCAGFLTRVQEVKERTNLPFISTINDITATMKEQMLTVKENADNLRAQLQVYADQVEAIANGENFD